MTETPLHSLEELPANEHLNWADPRPQNDHTVFSVTIGEQCFDAHEEQTSITGCMHEGNRTRLIDQLKRLPTELLDHLSDLAKEVSLAKQGLADFDLD